MTGLARANIIGRVVSDPISRDTRMGNPVCNLRVAVNRKKGQGEETTWLNVVAWGNLSLRCCEHVRKGMTVYIWGDIHGHEYKDRDGNPRYAIEIEAQEIQWKFDGKRIEAA